jgi:hypothetical protein
MTAGKVAVLTHSTTVLLTGCPAVVRRKVRVLSPMLTHSTGSVWLVNQLCLWLGVIRRTTLSARFTASSTVSLYSISACPRICGVYVPGDAAAYIHRASVPSILC